MITNNRLSSSGIIVNDIFEDISATAYLSEHRPFPLDVPIGKGFKARHKTRVYNSMSNGMNERPPI